jgi:MoaA/NifB/PqqE/SkfB family radical SAM enzyme
MKGKKIGGIILNPSCELSCFFCGGNKKESLSKKQLKEQEIRVYKNLKDYKKIGIESIEISGSDPIEYRKITELIKYIKSEGFKFIQLSTHGTKLIEEDFLNELILSGVDKLRIPIYGSSAKVHDSITRSAGSFEKTIGGLRKLIRKTGKIQLQISSLILRQNKEDLSNIVNLVNEIGVDDFYFSIPCIARNPDKWYIPIKDLQNIIKKIYFYALKVNQNTQFLEIPFCIVGVINLNNICNTTQPPHLGKYNQPPAAYKTEIPNLPSYRLKKHLDFCKNCVAIDYCDGFFVNDIKKYGIGKISPPKEFIQKKK